MDTITLTDGYLRGLDGGVIVEHNGTQVGHWPVGMDEAEESAREEWPEAEIKRVESESGAEIHCYNCGEDLYADDWYPQNDGTVLCGKCQAAR